MPELICDRDLANTLPLRPTGDQVILTSDRQAIRQILDPGSLAVILLASQPPNWLDELQYKVNTGQFVVPRTIIDEASEAEVVECVANCLDHSSLSLEARQELQREIESLVGTCHDLTGSNLFRFRMFTDTPNCRCSYHIDSVPTGVSTTALIRVFCGAATEYVPPENLRSWEDFYSYFFRRSRLAKAWTAARESRDSAAEFEAEAKLRRLDESASFLTRPELPPQEVPANALVACKFVDSRFLSGIVHLKARSARGWIHRSPMAGHSRFVATVNAVA